MSSKKKQQNIYSTAAKRMAAYQAEQAQASQVESSKGRDVKLGVLGVVGAVVIALAAQWTYFSFGPGHDKSTASASASASASPSASPSNAANVPNPSIAENRAWSGDMTINGAKLGLTLDGAKAPQAVANFVSLAKKGFFNGISCHRITTKGIYVLQCGDPQGTGAGGPGYSWGPIENAPADNVYKTGVLAMARQGNNGSSMGSQFFIVYKDSTIPSDSAGGYTVFGTVSNLSGIENVIAAGSDNSNGDGDGKPKVKTTISAVSVK
jgi:peptidyl-prolyl cis-trans isomerase B (cyclophilin B)